MKVKIERLGMNGEGVFVVPEGENCGKVGFVPFAMPSEVVEVEITKSKNSFCTAKLNKILQPSSARKTAECPYFSICGGCDLQHMDGATQIEFKGNKVKETIAKFAKLDVNINEVVHVNNYNYRNKMVFPFGYKDGQIVLGMYEKSSRNIVNIDKCLLASNGINEIFKLSQEFFKNSKYSVYNNKTKRGVLKHLVIRQFENSFLITLVVSKKSDTREFYDYLKKYFENIGISIIIGDSDDELLSGEYCYQYGLKSLELNEFEIKYNLDNRGFLQINNEVKQIAYNKILDMIDESDVVIDAYSGAGLLSSIIAKKCKKVVGIEINTSASKSAQEMSKINDLHNTMFINADVKDVISKLLDENKDCVLVLDPTRSGCEDIVLDKILENNLPKKIIYLSCNVATLSRDINKLKTQYDIKSVVALDMFPNTHHVETLVVMERK